MLNRDDYEQLVIKSNHTKSDYPKEKVIHQLIEEQAICRPNNIAVMNGGWKHEYDVTYKELNDKANQLANFLRKKGVLPNMAVAIILDRSPELVISILGILKAGGCYLPIDTELPTERIKFILEDSQCRFIISDLSHDPIKTNSQIEVIDINNLKDFSKEPTTIDNINTPKNLAYIIYTSGTTGNPKGVMIEHQSLVNYINWANKTYVRGEKASFPLYTSISFDLTITSIFLPLISGNTIVIYPDNDKCLPLEQVLEDNQINILKATPSHLKMLKESRVFKSDGYKSKIKSFIIGGEALTTQLAKDIYNIFEGNVEIYNEYGPTEATVGCMIYTYNEAKDQGYSVPIGVPIDNVHIYILDKYFKPVPIGVIGEIYISGDCLSRGYLFNAKLSGEKFIDNPFYTGQKMYKTGDLAKKLPDNNIEFIGRTDHQVKIKGYRIELSDIENHLMKHDQITHALVVDKQDNKGEKYLCAYFVTIKKSERLEVSGLRNYLSSRIPFYMIPSCFIQLDKMPLTKNGKINYKALPEPDMELERLIIVDPRNEIETLFVKIWQDILNVSSIGINDNFFELGGDSIKAVQISSRLFDKGISINVKDILTHQTIEQISVYAKFASEKSRYNQGLIKGEKGLTAIEAWFFKQDFHNMNYYNQSVLLVFKQKINIAQLEKAFNKLIEHHDGLRLNYKPVNHTLFYNNEILNHKFIIEVFDISTNGKDKNTSLIEIGSNLKSSIDITNGLPIKALIIKDNQSSKLLISAHHLVIDGISWRIYLEDLHNIYNSLLKDEEIRLPSKTASLTDWYNKIIEFAASEALQKEISYWQEIEDTDFEIPKDIQKDSIKVENTNRIQGSLSTEQTEFLLKDSRKIYHTDVLTLLVIALVKTIQEWTNKQEIVIELENHGRHFENIDVSKTIGWFTAMFPVKIIHKEKELKEQIKSIKEQIKKIPNNGVGYGILKYITKSVKAQKDTSEIRFNYLGQFDNEINNELFNFSDVNTGSETDPGNFLTTQIEINCMISQGQLNMEINYNDKSYKRETIERFNKAFFVHLNNILNHIKSEEDVHFTPSDFDAVELDEEDLNVLFG